MKYVLKIKPSCKKKINKLTKKNLLLKEAITKKVNEILRNPHHFKPLRNELSGVRRVHILKSFVLTYTVKENSIELIDFSHHDEAYQR